MYRITWILILMLFISMGPVAYAPDGDIDYSSDEELNSLSDQELASALESGKVPDTSKIDDNKLADAVSRKPSVTQELDDEDLTRALNQKPELMDKESVLQDVEQRAQQDTHILNSNPRVKEKWFSHYGIEDEGAEIASVDGNTVHTAGSQATSFAVDRFPGAHVTEKGALVLPSGSEIAGGEVSKEGDTVQLNGGEAHLSGDANEELVVQEGGTVHHDGRTFSSQEEMRVNTQGDSCRVSGEEVSVMDKESGDTEAQFSGSVSYESNKKTLNEGTEYTDYHDNEKSATYTADDATRLVKDPSACSEASTSCIANDGERLHIDATDDTEIDVQLAPKSDLEEADIAEITDESEVRLSRIGTTATFSKEPFTIKGGPATRLGIDVTTRMNEETYELNFIPTHQGKKTIDKEAFMDHMQYMLDEGYSIHDISFAAQVHYYGSLDYYGGVLDGALGPLSMKEGSQAEDYQNPQLKSHVEALLPKQAAKVNAEGQTYTIRHTFAGIGAAANSYPVWRRIKTWANTEGGDKFQVVSETGGNIKSGEFDIAEEYRPKAQQRANALGQQLAQEFATNSEEKNKDSDYILSRFSEEIEDINRDDRGCVGGGRMCMRGLRERLTDDQS